VENAKKAKCDEIGPPTCTTHTTAGCSWLAFFHAYEFQHETPATVTSHGLSMVSSEVKNDERLAHSLETK
jgi:G:T-mismatch repair DNA endonuclease (very short patch repair protein)